MQSFTFCVVDPLPLHRFHWRSLLGLPLFFNPLSPAPPLIHDQPSLTFWRRWARAGIRTLSDIWDPDARAFRGFLEQVAFGDDPRSLAARVAAPAPPLTPAALELHAAAYQSLCLSIPPPIVEALAADQPLPEDLLDPPLPPFPAASLACLLSSFSFRGSERRAVVPVAQYTAAFGYLALLGPTLAPPAAEYAHRLGAGHPRTWAALASPARLARAQVAYPPIRPPGAPPGPLGPLPDPLPADFWDRHTQYIHGIFDPEHERLARWVHCRTLPCGPSRFPVPPPPAPPLPPAASPFCHRCSAASPVPTPESIEHIFCYCPVVRPTLAWARDLFARLAPVPDEFSPLLFTLGVDLDPARTYLTSHRLWPPLSAAIRYAIWLFRNAGRHGRLPPLHPPHLPPGPDAAALLALARSVVAGVLRSLVARSLSSRFTQGVEPLTATLTALVRTYPRIHRLFSPLPLAPSLFSLDPVLFPDHSPALVHV